MSFFDEVLAVALPRCVGHAQTRDCRYRIEWSINPHMRPGAADELRAEVQHRTLVRELRRADAKILELPFVHGAFDSVFIKDNALLTPRGALLARFAEPVRQNEQHVRGRELERAGFRVFDSPDFRFEGGDVVRFPDGSALLGHGFRSDCRARAALREFLDSPVMALRLVDPWLYHLDTALSILDDGTVLLCREAFGEESLRLLGGHPQVKELCFVPRQEALRFALNFVQVKDTIITGADAPMTRSLLEARGLRVRQVRLSEFQLAGGSAACLVSRVYSERRRAMSDTSEMRSTSA